MITSKSEGIYPSHRLGWKRVDVGLLGLLVLALMLYQLQLLMPKIAGLHVRETLYLYLYVRFFLVYRPRLTKPLLTTVLFLGGASLVAVHTFYVAGSTIAMPAFTRFVHLALLAPLATALLEDERDIRLMIYLWMGVVVIGVMTVVYQMLGGEMAWLVQNYIAIRGDLVRHKSLMGEPNVGGIAAALLYVFASMVVKKTTIRYLLIFASSFLVVVSISKAAVVGFVFANFAVLLSDYYTTSKAGTVFPSRQLRMQVVALSLWLLLLACHPLLYQYMEVGVNSFIGRQPAVPGAIEDFGERFVFSSYGGGFDLKGVGQLVFGQSFTRAGSVAVERHIPNAVGPHNMYLEVYLVGGLLLLASLIVLQGLVIKKLMSSALRGISLDAVLLPIFVLISLYMTGYPNLYEPITGTLFWLVVGVTCRSSSAVLVGTCEVAEEEH